MSIRHHPSQMLLFEAPVPKPVRRSGPVLFDRQAGGRRGGTGVLRVCVLGSGSSGNATVVKLGGAVVLVDAGFGPRTTARLLNGIGLSIDDIDAICLTHLDHDHFKPTWFNTLAAKRIAVYLHTRHLKAIYRRGENARLLERAGLLREVNGQPFEPVAGLSVRTVALPHDRKGTTGFLMESQAGRIGYATDLGCVPDELITRFAGVDLLAIESNYDPRMQVTSDRPEMLKQRIMGGRGHLSNEQAFDAVQRITDQCPHGGPRHVVLLHPSRQCNCPQAVRRVFDQDSRLAGRVILTEQGKPTAWLSIK